MTAGTRGLTVRAGATTVLDAVDLELRAGSVTALVGESGCGKSMVAAALCGLLPAGTAGSGEVTVAGRALTQHDRAWSTVRGHVVGVVPQSPITSFTPVRSLRSQLDEVIAALGGTRSAEELCAAAGLPAHALPLYPHELSGGMAQRAAVAAALAGAPSVVLADEPTSALDPETAHGVLRLLRGLADDGAAVLIVTHDLRSVLATGCESLAVMRAGRILLQGPPESVRAAAASDHYIAAFFEEVR
ncbi:ATP-binding cassette domain-containing protein [Tsukamurella ocularis]|uniref:ATP-binding cassette domain-containing protein n=1 Tax=Tsukamurella ocularis TaxID=1970234 RepID=UPI0039EF083F